METAVRPPHTNFHFHDSNLHNIDFSTSGQQVSAQYGGAQYYNESDGYMSNSDMPPWNGYSYTSSPDFYQTNGNVHSVNNQYPGAKPHHTQQQYPSGNAQYHNNKYQYLDHNAQHVGANAQYYGNDTMYPAQGSRYPFNSSVSVGVSPQANVTSGASREVRSTASLDGLIATCHADQCFRTQPAALP